MGTKQPVQAGITDVVEVVKLRHDEEYYGVNLIDVNGHALNLASFTALSAAAVFAADVFEAIKSWNGTIWKETV